VYIPINVLAAKANGHIGSGAGYAFVALTFLYGIFWSFTWNPGCRRSTRLRSLHNETRAKGMAFQSFVSGLASFINTYSTSVTLQNIGWKTYNHLFGLPSFPTVARHVGDGRRDQGQVA
jgi:hypothetical protein